MDRFKCPECECEKFYLDANGASCSECGVEFDMDYIEFTGN